MQVCVPLDWAAPPAGRRDIGTDGGVDLSTAFAAYQGAKDAFHRALKAKTEQVTLLREQLEQANARADRAEAAANWERAAAQAERDRASEFRQANGSPPGRRPAGARVWKAGRGG